MFTEDKLAAGETPARRAERRRLLRNAIRAERRRVLDARLRAEAEEAELEDEEVEEVEEEEIPAARGGMAPRQIPANFVVELDSDDDSVELGNDDDSVEGDGAE